jgi:predicted nucleotidyltransferase
MVSMRQIRSVAQRIGREFRPERVILFGSHAYGRPTPDSDVDLLVIMPVRGNPLDKAAEIRRQVRPPFPTDLAVRTPAEVRRRLRWNDFFLKEIIEKGKVLYESAYPRVGGQGRRRLRHRRPRTPRAPSCWRKVWQ